MRNIFNTEFYRMLIVQTLASIITLIIAVTVSFYIGGKVEQLTELFDSVDSALARIEALVEVGPEGILDVSNAINDSADSVGVSVGDGGAEVVGRVGEAWNNFRSGSDD